uniref:SPOR domain-containing protein n=1 Tax=Magnetococcus massalia (strain MO-1) TaxID=451514 RepID=A0A1S7LNN6_MAGMO|nr:Conserved protein of unknown function. putative Sporulation domain protein [Candidatus Magnetococcus massalia]
MSQLSTDNAKSLHPRWVLIWGLGLLAGCSSPIQELPIYYATPDSQERALAMSKRAAPEAPMPVPAETQAVEAEVLTPPSVKPPPELETSRMPQPEPMMDSTPEERSLEQDYAEALSRGEEVAESARLSPYERPLEPMASGDGEKANEVIAPPAPVDSVGTSPKMPEGPYYYIELGSYAHALNADRLKRKVMSMGIPVKSNRIKVRSTGFHRVRAGPFAFKVEAEWAMRVLKGEKLSVKLVKSRN